MLMSAADYSESLRRVELVENLLDRGMLADAQRRIAINRQPGRCCTEGCKPDN